MQMWIKEGTFPRSKWMSRKATKGYHAYGASRAGGNRESQASWAETVKTVVKTYDRPLAEQELTWFGDLGLGVGRSYSALTVNCHLLTAETILSQPGMFFSWAKWPN